MEESKMKKNKNSKRPNCKMSCSLKLKNQDIKSTKPSEGKNRILWWVRSGIKPIPISHKHAHFIRMSILFTSDGKINRRRLPWRKQ